MSIVVTAVARDFFPDEIGLFERFFLASQFYFCHHKAVIITMEFIDLPCVSAIGTLHQVTMLVDEPRLAQEQKVTSISKGDFCLELITGQALAPSRPFDGQIGTVVPNTNAHRAPWLRSYIALLNVATGISLSLKLAFDKEFPLYFLCHDFVTSWLAG